MVLLSLNLPAGAPRIPLISEKNLSIKSTEKVLNKNDSLIKHSVSSVSSVVKVKVSPIKFAASAICAGRPKRSYFDYISRLKIFSKLTSKVY